MEKRQRFSAEFKRETIRMMQASGKPAAVVAGELGVPAIAYTNGRSMPRRKAIKRSEAVVAPRPANMSWHACYGITCRAPLLCFGQSVKLQC
jgi:transposase-like protein